MGPLECSRPPDIIIEINYPLQENIKFFGINDYLGEEADEKEKKKEYLSNTLYDQDNSKNIGNDYEVPINISSSQINNEEDNESSNKELSTNVNNQNIKLKESKNQNEINQKIKESLEFYQHDFINNNKNIH